MASESKPSTKPPFPRLPAEIRNQIFILALVESETFLATIRTDGLRYYAHPLPPALARVCRQTRKEAVPIFYGANSFKFDCSTFCLKWHDELSGCIIGAASHVRKIVLDSDYHFTSYRYLWEHHRADTTLALDNDRAIKIYHSKPRNDTCTCYLEAAGHEMNRTSKFSHNNPLFIFASRL